MRRLTYHILLETTHYRFDMRYFIALYYFDY